MDTFVSAVEPGQAKQKLGLASFTEFVYKRHRNNGSN